MPEVLSTVVAEESEGFCMLCNPAAQVHQYQVKGLRVQTQFAASLGFMPITRFFCVRCIEELNTELRKKGKTNGK